MGAATLRTAFPGAGGPARESEGTSVPVRQTSVQEQRPGPRQLLAEGSGTGVTRGVGTRSVRQTYQITEPERQQREMKGSC